MTYCYQTNKIAFEYTESNVDTPILWENHCHALFEMIAVIEGDISIMIEGRCYRLTENQTAIIPPLFYHTIAANKTGAYRRVTALFDITSIPFVLQSQFKKKDSHLTIFFSHQINELKKICENDNKSFYEPLAHSLMTQIFYNDVQTKPSNTAEETDEFLQKIITYIDLHIYEKILLEDLAALTSRSKSSFCHLFEKKMNISPKQYILQKKLALANKLIVDGTPPTTAAMQIGYENYSNFYRMYRKCFGTAPTNYNRK